MANRLMKLRKIANLVTSKPLKKRATYVRRSHKQEGIWVIQWILQLLD